MTAAPPPAPDLLGAAASAGIVPVATRLAPVDAPAVAAALARAGIPVLEVTLRAAGALESIAAVAADLPPGFALGAGTVLTAAQVDAAAEAGATFVVSPGFSPTVVAWCRELGLACVPGVATATEVMAALDAGCDLLKLFPAEAVGGVAALRALAAPFPMVRWIPTGGVGPGNLAAYLAVAAVVAVGGSWMVRPELIEGGHIAEVERLAREAADLVREAREAVR